MNQDPLHIITCEFPPEKGGVADYTLILSRELSRLGQEVVVWAPPEPASGTATNSPEVKVVRLRGRFLPSDLLALERELNRYPGPRQLLVQWVPHGYGLKSMNLFFCAWITSRAMLSGDRLQVMVHEPCAPYRGLSVKGNLIAFAHRLMLLVLLHKASRIWVSTPTWVDRIRPYSPGSAMPIRWLPIWSNIARIDSDPGSLRRIRTSLGFTGKHLIGHFGTYSSELGQALDAIMVEVLERRDDVAFLLLGRGGAEFLQSFRSRNARLAQAVHATGHLPDHDLSLRLSTCDLMLQPYTGGINVRHGSALAVISHGLPMVTNRGIITENLWEEPFGGLLCPSMKDAAVFADAVTALLTDADRRRQMSEDAARFYEKHFSVAQSAARLLG